MFLFMICLMTPRAFLFSVCMASDLLMSSLISASTLVLMMCWAALSDTMSAVTLARRPWTLVSASLAMALALLMPTFISFEACFTSSSAALRAAARSFTVLAKRESLRAERLAILSFRVATEAARRWSLRFRSLAMSMVSWENLALERLVAAATPSLTAWTTLL